jgi:hypothetical protein
MTTYPGYAINMLLTNGDIATMPYATQERAYAAWFKVVNNPLVVHASLHDEHDVELASVDRS